MKNEGKERMKWDDLIAGEGVVEKIIFFAFFVKGLLHILRFLLEVSCECSATLIYICKAALAL